MALQSVHYVRGTKEAIAVGKKCRKPLCFADAARISSLPKRFWATGEIVLEEHDTHVEIAAIRFASGEQAWREQMLRDYNTAYKMDTDGDNELSRYDRICIFNP